MLLVIRLLGAPGALVSAGLQSIGYPRLEAPYTPEHYPLQFIPTPEEQQWATRYLHNEGIETPYNVGAGFTPARANPAPLVIIHPGSGAAVKLWRTRGWAFCADALTKSLTMSTPVRMMLTGSKKERPMLEEIARNMQSPAVLVTDATIGQLAALQAKAVLVMSVDSGPLHLAVSQGTPTFQLFGPTDPRIFGPIGKERTACFTRINVSLFLMPEHSLWTIGFLSRGSSRPSLCSTYNGAAGISGD
jgi:ADP-heptose:LPS heptosyltransferase